MRKNILKTLLIVFAGLIIMAKPALAREYTVQEKELKLSLVLEKYNSPMVGLESVLIESAEKYGLDWTLIAAISGTESSFAKRMPYECINPFGWGIYGSNKLCFDSLEEAIKGVSEGIGTKYNTNSLESIARTYNPAHTTKWIKNTTFFMNKIENQDIPASKLPLDL